MSRLDDAVTRILTVMFAHGWWAGRTAGDAGDAVDERLATPTFALSAAERSAVLLKDAGGVLPLDPARPTGRWR